MQTTLEIPNALDIKSLCEKYHIVRLSLFGSALRRELGPESDIDLLIEFEKSHIPGFLKLARIEREFSVLFHNQRIDLRTPEDLSQYFRQDVLDKAEPIYNESR